MAIAWDGFRSRIYFDGSLVLTKNHPAGFHPELDERSTLHLGGMLAGTTSGSSYSRAPWGKTDTVLDELTVYPGALGAVQVAALAGKAIKARPIRGLPHRPHRLVVPRLRAPPQLDGRLDDGEWDGAATLRPLIDGRNFGRSFDYPEQYVHLAYDADNLYVAMRSHFPAGAAITQAPVRRSLDDPDIEVWPSESFELWLLVAGEPHPYRFAGSPGGGFTERHGKDDAWNGTWTYRTSMGMTIHSTQYWDMERAASRRARRSRSDSVCWPRRSSRCTRDIR